MSRQFEVKQGQPWGWTHPKKNPCPFCGEFLLSRAVGDDPLSFRLYCDDAECEVREFRIEASQVEVSLRTEELDALKTSGHGRDWNGESGVYIDQTAPGTVDYLMATASSGWLSLRRKLVASASRRAWSHAPKPQGRSPMA
jgi:hypothetical protein